MLDPFRKVFILVILILVLPCKFLTVMLHNWLTKRDYSVSIDDILDLAIAVCVLILVILFVKWSDYTNDIF